jgi:CheY-like chemotaxis protein
MSFVTDVVMPGMDGPTWVRRALKTRPNVRWSSCRAMPRTVLNDDQGASELGLPAEAILAERSDGAADSAGANFTDPAARLQPRFRRAGGRREIGQDAVAARALEGQQAFQHRLLAVDPAVAAPRP